MTAAAEWVKCGNRSHPNLKLIDEELTHRSTYPGHEGDLRELERLHFAGDTFFFAQTLHKIRESQKVSAGDRSHPRLVKLDALRETLTYDGWESDCEGAEREHVRRRNGFDFDHMILGMKRKQTMHNGDRTHKDLRFLDSLSLSYPGWEEDVSSAMLSHHMGYSMNYERYHLLEKQRVFEGDRSHPRLVELDSLQLTYPGWKQDVKEVEEGHLGKEFWLDDGVTERYSVLLQCLERKQREFVTGVEDTLSMNPIQREIVETHWTYPGHQQDVKRAKKSFDTLLFNCDLEKCRLRQMIHDGDYGSHPALIKLDEVRRTLSYPGFQADVELAKSCLSKYGYRYFQQYYFDENIQGMKNKQSVYADMVGVEPPDSRVLAQTPEGAANAAPARPSGRAGPRRFLPRLRLAMPPRPRRKKERARRREDDFGRCIICMDAPRTHVFVPCGHMCACPSCSAKLMEGRRKCPMCARAATMTMEVFVP